MPGADGPALNASITSSKVVVGVDPPDDSHIALRIRPSEAAIAALIEALPTKGRAELTLTFDLGDTETALFLNSEDAEGCIMADVPTDWNSKRHQEGVDSYSIVLYTYDDPFQQSRELSIKLTKVKSETPPGDARVTVSANFVDSPEKLGVRKEAKLPGIIGFWSDPPSCVLQSGTTLSLKWRTHGLTNLELLSSGIEKRTTIATIDANHRDEGHKQITRPAVDTTYWLEGRVADGEVVEERLLIRVLEERWYDVRVSDPNDPSAALEPTLVVNADKVWLYGIFRSRGGGDGAEGRARLFRTRHPLEPWSPVDSTVSDREGLCVPEGFATSPGVYFHGRIWLIGGSAVDPDFVSNCIWSIDPNAEDPKWTQEPTPEWPPRMGHAVSVFENTIWVMGGRRDPGIAENDVWTFDVDGQSWTRRNTPVPWGPRCLFSVVPHDQDLWLFGGVDEPFSDDIYDEDFYVYDASNGAWANRRMEAPYSSKTEAGKAITSCLQVFPDAEGNPKLHLIARVRTVDDRGNEVVRPTAHMLSTPGTKTWNEFPSERLMGWGGDQTGSLQLVNFGDRALVARILDYDTPTTTLKAYVRR